VEAPFERIADVVGAGVVVIAVESHTCTAHTVGAEIVDCARVTIFARGIVVGSGAPDSRLARVIRAEVAIVAIEGLSAHTGTLAAGL